MHSSADSAKLGLSKICQDRERERERRPRSELSGKLQKEISLKEIR